VDLGVRDLQRSGAFYTGLFGWDVAQPSSETAGYAVCSLGGRVVAGLGQRADAGASVWSTYLSVEDVEGAVVRAAQHGWQVLAPATDVAGPGRNAFGADPTGAAYGLWQPGSLIGVGLHDEAGALAWNELMTRDRAAAEEFYGQVYGWTFEPLEGAGSPAYSSARAADGSVVCGVGGIHPSSGTRSHWVAYFCVEDTDATAARVMELGGTVTFEPFDSPFGRVAVTAGPDGEVFCLIDSVGGHPLELANSEQGRQSRDAEDLLG
jgi:predicted enzyme related to lactoylglutathione lyase